MISGGPSGFGNAPVTKTIMFLTIAGSVTQQLLLPEHLRKRDLLSLSLFPAISRDYQYWRFLTSHWAFSSPGETLFGLVLLYSFRLFERQFGSKKFAFAMGSLLAFSTVFETLALLIIPTLKSIPAGPYALIFGMFVFFFLDVPQLTRARVCGIPMSDKTILYILGLQVLVSHYPASVAPAVCGLLAGLLYRTPLVAPFITRLSRLVTWSSTRRERSGGYARVGAEPEDAIDMPAGADAPEEVEMQASPMAPAPAPAVRSRSSEVDAGALSQLMSMGFDEAVARRTLIATQNNVEVALNRLLDR